MKKILVIVLLLQHWHTISYDIPSDQIPSTFSTTDPIEQIAKQRYKDAWFFKQKRQDKYQRLANNLDQDVQKALINHRFNNLTPNDEQTLGKVNAAIKNLQSNKRFSFSGNNDFSGHLVQDLKDLSKKIQENILSNTSSDKRSSELSSTTPIADRDQPISPAIEYQQKLAKIDFKQQLNDLNEEKLKLSAANQTNEKELAKLNKRLIFNQSQLDGIYNQISEIKTQIPARYFHDDSAMQEYARLIEAQTELKQLPEKLNATAYQRKINLIADIAALQKNIQNFELYNQLNDRRTELESKIQNLNELKIPFLKAKEELNDQMYDLNTKITNMQHKQKLATRKKLVN